MSLAVRAPRAGTVVSVENVPDPVFSAHLVGPGLAWSGLAWPGLD